MPKPISRLLLLVEICCVVLFAVGCSGLPFGLPTPDPLPTATVTPTPRIPDGPYPPILLEYSPSLGSEVTTDSAVVLYFDQPMERASVVEALQVRPEVCADPVCAVLEGDVVWRDDVTLAFSPQGLVPAARYRVSLAPTALSREGVSLSQEIVFAFSTLSPLEVSQVNPVDMAEGLRADTPVLVMFNRPVVNLDCVGKIVRENTDCPGLPLKFSPGVLGQGDWVNPSIYRYRPLNGWGAGQLYQVDLEAGVTSVKGPVLETSLSWSFSTALPVIVSVTPENGAKNVDLDSEVRVVFNTPMDMGITGSVFSVSNADGNVVPGVVTWEDSGAELVFKPNNDLVLGVRYRVSIGERARAVTSAPLQNPQTWNFDSESSPAVVGFNPPNGADDVSIQVPLLITFDGAIDETTLENRVIVVPEMDASSYAYFDADSGIYHLSWDMVPQTEYCVTLQPGISDVHGNSISEGQTSCFTTGDFESFVGLISPLEMVTLDASEVAFLHFFARNQEQAAFELYQLDELGFLAGNRSSGVSLRDWTETFDAPLNETSVNPVALSRLEEALDTGYYQLEWETPQWGANRSINIAVVDYHVTLKLAEEEALVWVTDLRSSEPITRTPVRLVDREGLLIAAGSTDVDGIARIPISPRDDLLSGVAAIVGEPGFSGFGVAMTYWLADARPQVFDIVTDSGPFTPYTAFLQTDRPVFRPGQVVNFYGALREENNVGYHVVPSDFPVMVALYDPSQNMIYSDTLLLSSLGTFSGKILLSDDAINGDYTLQVSRPDFPNISLYSLLFVVRDYRQSDFNLAIFLEGVEFLSGDDVVIRGEARRLSGHSLNDASIQWSVSARPYHFEPALPGEWEWGGDTDLPSSEPLVVVEGVVPTDAEGAFSIEFAAELADLGDDQFVNSQLWTVEATLVTDDGAVAVIDKDLIVHAAEFYLGLSPQQRVYEVGEQDAVVEIFALDRLGAPVRNQLVLLALYHREWYPLSISRPFALPTWGYTDTLISSPEYTTGSDGKVSADELSFPLSGAYVVIAKTEDENQHIVSAETSLSIGGPGRAQWKSLGAQITPVANASHYSVGDVARILLPTSFEGPYQVLVTIERDGIHSVERLDMEEDNPVIPVTILDSYLPNVYVSFVLIRGGEFPDVRFGYVDLPVESNEPVIAVEIVPQQAGSYAPGDDVVLTVRTTDQSGAPVDAVVTLAGMDKTLLSLSNFEAASIVDAFHGMRPLEIATGDTLLMLYNRLAQQLSVFNENAERLIAEALLGGSDAGSSALRSSPVLASDTLDTLFWDTSVRTGDSGETEVVLHLPEALTTWLVTAQAITADTRTGSGYLDLLVTKPLSLSPIIPSFFVERDRSEVALVAYNNTAKSVDVVLGLEAERGVEVASRLTQTVTLSPGKSERVSWTVSVPSDGVDSDAFLKFSAQMDDYHDVVVPTADTVTGGIPVYRYESRDLVGTAGVLDAPGSRVDAFVTPVQPRALNSLRVYLTPSIAAAMVSGARYIESYPLDSTDMIIGRLMSNAIAVQTLKDSGADSPALEEEFESAFDVALEALEFSQRVDGGWNWLTEDTSNLQVTAYAIVGLLRAQQAGFEIPQDMLDDALEYVSDALVAQSQAETHHQDAALALYALSEASLPWPTGSAAMLYGERNSLGVSGRAYLALALALADESDTRIATLLDELSDMALVTARGVHWEERLVQYWSSDVSATAVVLKALANLAEDNPQLPQIARWLLLERTTHHWESPYASAWALNALRDYMPIANESDYSYVWEAYFNGISLTEVMTGTRTFDIPWLAQVSAIDSQPTVYSDRPNVLEITRGEGLASLYYAAYLQYSLPSEAVVADSRGLTLYREYCALPLEKQSGSALICEPLTEIAVGDMVEVRLTLVLPQTRHYLTLKDFYPAGLEPLDETVGIDSKLWGQVFEQFKFSAGQAVFVTSELSAGTYRVSYRLRAVTPGSYQILPAWAAEIYSVDLWAHTDGAMLDVSPLE